MRAQRDGYGSLSNNESQRPPTTDVVARSFEHLRNTVLWELCHGHPPRATRANRRRHRASGYKTASRQKLAVGAWHGRGTSPPARHTYRIRDLLRPVLNYGLDGIATPADPRDFDNAVENDVERREEVGTLGLRDSSARKCTTLRKRREGLVSTMQYRMPRGARFCAG